MENLHSMEFEKYKKYLISTWLSEYEAEHTERFDGGRVEYVIR